MGQVMIGDATIIHRIKQHLGKVQDLAFSADSKFMATIGGQDDNALIIWDVESGDYLLMCVFIYMYVSLYVSVSLCLYTFKDKYINTYAYGYV